MHIPVLYNEILEYLDIQSDDVVVDATINGGGHAEMMAGRLAPDGMLIGIDQDSSGLDRSRERLANMSCQIQLVHDNFRNIKSITERLGVTPTKMLFDLGWSSNQFADPDRGFSFQVDGPLDMRLGDDRSDAVTAHDIVNTWSQENIADIIYGFGDERYSRRIAQRIVDTRTKGEIKTTFDLVNIIESAVPSAYRRGKTHYATKTFQALRIAVNEELTVIHEALPDAISVLATGGIIAVITFHSIEDRIVKRIFKDAEDQDLVQRLTKKPIVASEEEITENRRARSAKLRIVKKN